MRLDQWTDGPERWPRLYPHFFGPLEVCWTQAQWDRAKRCSLLLAGTFTVSLAAILAVLLVLALR